MNEALKLSLPAVLPTIAVLIGILLNKTDINRLDAQMSKLNDRMDAMSNKMDALRDSFHSDILMLVQRDGDKDSRIARLEERTKSSS